MLRNPSLQRIKAISFDLDDTLWDCAPAIDRGDSALWQWHQQHTPRISDEHTRESLLSFRSEVRAKHPELQGCVTAMRVKGIKLLLAQFGYPESLAEEAFSVFYQARSNVDLYPDAEPLLEALASKYTVVAITNGNADLNVVGIDQYFAKTYAANLELSAKPASVMFDQCLEDFGLEADTLLHIGDNPVADVIGGHNAGVQTLWFNQYNAEWPPHLDAPHYEARSLGEVRRLLG